MGRFSVIRAEEEERWQAVLGRVSRHDFYHLPVYHRLAEKRGEGKARLFVYEDGDRCVALPLLLRPVETVPGLERAGRGLHDATSVYGYAGPLASGTGLPDGFLEDFRSALRSALGEIHVVSVFSRLHPLIEQQRILAGVGECRVMGSTVSIDLTLPADFQFSRYRQSHRYEVNRLRRMGAVCREDAELNHLDEFIVMYTEAMKRADATAKYFFDRAYFREVAGMSCSHLLTCTIGGEIICGGIFVLSDGIVQYHLSGWRLEFQKLAPTKLLIDGARLWANEKRATVLHLGGGLGSRGDSLFQFKAGFSDRRHDFLVWRWEVEPGVYESLCRARELWNRHNGLCAAPGFFPAYRSPAATEGEVEVKARVEVKAEEEETDTLPASTLTSTSTFPLSPESRQ